MQIDIAPLKYESPIGVVHLKQTVVHRNGQNLIVNSMAHFDIINTRHPKRKKTQMIVVHRHWLVDADVHIVVVPQE